MIDLTTKNSKESNLFSIPAQKSATERIANFVDDEKRRKEQAADRISQVAIKSMRFYIRNYEIWVYREYIESPVQKLQNCVSKLN